MRLAEHKAVQDSRTPERCRAVSNASYFGQVLKCGYPLPLCVRWLVIVILLNLSAPSALLAGDHFVCSAADISRLTPSLRPGDSLVLSNGTWLNETITFHASGTPEKPITLRAESPGRVILSGRSALVITGENLIVSGLYFDHCSSTGDGILLAGKHGRITDSAVVGGNYKFLVHFNGSENRMDHCYLAGKTNDSPTLQVEVGSAPNHHLIDHNHFGPRPPLGRNGGETMRVGYSWQSMSNSATIVEHNLFEHCDGEIEIISNKSCENIYRDNTFLDCAGMVTLRHGNRCVVQNNFIIGHHKRGSGGIRVIGDDHSIINNYIDSVYQGSIWITSGISNSPLKGYFQARNAKIAFNTFVDSRGPCIDLSAGLGTSGRTLLPENIVISSNLFALRADGVILKGTEGHGLTTAANLVAPPTSEGAAPAKSNLHAGFELTNAKLSYAAGLWRFRDSTDSTPSRGGSRETLFVGGNLASTSQPLTATEVGPAWLGHSAR